MASPGTIRPFIGDKLVNYTGSNCTIDDALASSTDATSGIIWYGAQSVAMLSASTASVLTRNAVGDYSWFRTAGGAETHYAVAQIELPFTSTTAKGLKIAGFWISYTLGVADATSVDCTAQKTTYANAAAAVVATYGGAQTYDAAHNTANLRKSSTGGVNPHFLNIQFGTPAYVTTRGILVTVETAFVLANTGTLAVNGVGWDYTFNYNGA